LTPVAETVPAPPHAHGDGHGHGAGPGQAGAHGNGRPLSLVHQFEDLYQQKSAAVLGMWAFLGTEVMFFGGLIATYIVYRFTSPDVWGAASHYGLNVTLGTINTVVLLTSSLAMALAVHAGATGERLRQVRFLELTLGLGLLFMAIKAYEYREEYLENLIPGPGFSTHALHLPEEPAPAAESAAHRRESATTLRTASILSVTPVQFVHQRAQLFFVFYFFMTGLHLLHMIIGVGLVSWVLLLARRGRFTAEYHIPLEIVGLYWHFIDIVWVFLYPLLYLVAIHK
jgi:cytochrome c oxidase subunit 3